VSLTLEYGRRARDICRYIPDQVDAAVSRFVRSVTPNADGRAAAREGLDDAAGSTLHLFAWRRAAAALRDESLSEAHEAIGALCLIPAEVVDWRGDPPVDLPLLAIRQLGGDVDATIEQASATGDRGIAANFKSMAPRARDLTLNDCGLMEVRSHYGLGFVDTMWQKYRPRADLIGMSIVMADHVESARRYDVTGIRLSPLPAVWFDPNKRADEVPTLGCVTFIAELSDAEPMTQGLMVFLGEVESPRMAQYLAERAQASSRDERPHVAAAVGSTLLLLIGGSFTLGQTSIETATSLENLADELVRAASPG
jgi:hypothetical protein